MTILLYLMSFLIVQRAAVPVDAGISWTVRVDDGSSLPNGGALSVQFEINGSAGAYCCRGGRPPGAPPNDPLRLQHLSTGANVVSVTKVPLGYFVKSLSFDGVDLLVSPLTLPAKTANAQIEVVLTKTPPSGRSFGFDVSGRVTNLELPQSEIRLMLREVSSRGEVISIGTAANELAVVGSASRGLAFDVAGKNVTNLELRFELPARVVRPEYPVPLSASSIRSIGGTVEVANGSLPKFEVQLVATRAGMANHAEAISGREFTVPLPEGEYRVSVSKLPKGYRVVSVRSGPLDLTEPFLVTGAGIADRFTGVAAGAGIAVQLSAPSSGK